jgi:hypothetical protein
MADTDPASAERYALRAWLGTGKSKPRRVALDLHYNRRTSLWSEIAERAHLIVAAVGTVALLGMAGTAIWMVLPNDGHDDIVSVAEAAPAEPQSKSVVADATHAAQPQKVAVAANIAPSKPAPKTQQLAALGQARGLAPIPVKAVKVAVQPDVEPLDETDPRWNAGKQAAARVAAIAEDEEESKESGETVSAFADGEGADNSSTAAIPLAKMAADADAAKAEEEKVAMAGRPGSAVRSVTMRSKPSSRGTPIGTVPGKSAVQVISCSKWCEIVYNGKRGFVYRTFLKNNGR